MALLFSPVMQLAELGDFNMHSSKITTAIWQPMRRSRFRSYGVAYIVYNSSGIYIPRRILRYKRCKLCAVIFFGVIILLWTQLPKWTRRCHKRWMKWRESLIQCWVLMSKQNGLGYCSNDRLTPRSFFTLGGVKDIFFKGQAS